MTQRVELQALFNTVWERSPRMGCRSMNAAGRCSYRERDASGELTGGCCFIGMGMPDDMAIEIDAMDCNTGIRAIADATDSRARGDAVVMFGHAVAAFGELQDIHDSGNYWDTPANNAERGQRLRDFATKHALTIPA